MANKGAIEADKKFFKDFFSQFWFRIPHYQRPYLWQEEQVLQLVEDLHYAAFQGSGEQEYFLGSMVLQRIKNSGNGYEIIDGQQRTITLQLLVAVIRDVTTDDKIKAVCEAFIFQQGNEVTNVQETIRVTFEERQKANEFLQTFVRTTGGTNNQRKLKTAAKATDPSVKNMAKAILTLHTFFGKEDWDKGEEDELARYLFNNALIIYVASENLIDAYRLFTVLNDRGLSLADSDVIKARNLSEIQDEEDRRHFSMIWARIEQEFGIETLQSILKHVRDILIRKKTTTSLLQDFSDGIYEYNPELKVGRATLSRVLALSEIYRGIYLLDQGKILADPVENNAYRNLITVMREGIKSSDWVALILLWFWKFRDQHILEFLIELENKISADWICRVSPATRVKYVYTLLNRLHVATSPLDILEDSKLFKVNIDNLRKEIQGDLYRKNYLPYLMLKLEWLLKDHSSEFKTIKHTTVDQILPQKLEGEWAKQFTPKEHKELVFKLGNLVLLNRRANSKYKTKNFKEKQADYYSSSAEIFTQVKIVMQYENWTTVMIRNRHIQLMKLLLQHYDD